MLKAVQVMREQRARAAATPPPEPQYVPVPSGPLTPYEQCLASGRVGCDRLYGEYSPPWYYPVYYPAHARRVASPGRPPPPAKPPNIPRREASPHAAPRNQGVMAVPPR